MGIDHFAMATRDMAASHAFYETATGFRLVKVEIGPTPEGGWAKHFFYDTGGGGMLAIWELHGDAMPAEFETGLSRAAGLPLWVNHLAFSAADPEELDQRKARWLEHGYTVDFVDHHWCQSIYTIDPNKTLVEFCAITGALTAEDRARALEALERDDLPYDPLPRVERFTAQTRPLHKRLAEEAAGPKR